MRMDDGKFTVIKRWLIGISGICLAYASIEFSRQGVGIIGEMAWVGTVVAVSLTCAELLFNSNFDELNWTILVLGLGAYIYSIWTNIVGFYFYRAMPGDLFSAFDITNLAGGIFMDVYPELAISWALKESKIGDLLGNIIKTSKNPSKLTHLAHPLQKSHQQNFGQNSMPSNLPYMEGKFMEQNGKTRAEILRRKMKSSQLHLGGE